MQTSPSGLYEFGAFQLDRTRRLLRRLDGTPVPLTSRVFETLLFMVEHHDAVLDKERIMEAVWPDSIVEENNLAQAISKLRQVFVETPGSKNYIVTVPRRGYAFVAEVKQRAATPAAAHYASGGTHPFLLPGNAGSEETLSKATTDDRVQTPVATPLEQPLKTHWLWTAAISAVAILCLAIFLVVRYRTPLPSHRASSSSVSAGAGLSSPTSIPEKSVAVLPFD